MRVLSWTWKHSTDLYDASTPEKLERSARAILKELLEMGYIYEPDEPTFDPKDDELMKLTKEQLDALPEPIRTETLDKYVKVAKRRKAARLNYFDAKQEYDAALKLSQGEPYFVRMKTREKYSDEAWAEILEAASKWRDWDACEVREDGIHRPLTAWQILQGRSGFEYEDYELMNVMTFDD